MKVRIVFDDIVYLYQLIGQMTLGLDVELVHIPSNSGELWEFIYDGKNFFVNPSFSGFVGVSYKND